MKVKLHSANQIAAALEVSQFLDGRITPEFVLSSDYDALYALAKGLASALDGLFAMVAGESPQLLEDDINAEKAHLELLNWEEFNK
jgi:hypothetical protein